MGTRFLVVVISGLIPQTGNSWRGEAHHR